MSAPLLSPGELADKAGVTVRTLHHYEALGLLRPHRSDAGHRRYRAEDLQRMLRIVWLRRLGFALEAIAPLLTADAATLRGGLRRQRESLARELDEAASRLRALDSALLQTQRLDDTMSLNDLSPPQPAPGATPFADEAERRWGDSPQWHTAEQRRKARRPADDAAMHAEEGAIVQEWAALLRTGQPANSEAAMAVAERHRAHIHRWHYPCSREMHARLAQMYTGDARFADHFDKVEPGLSAFVAASIQAAAQS